MQRLFSVRLMKSVDVTDPDAMSVRLSVKIKVNQ